MEQSYRWTWPTCCRHVNISSHSVFFLLPNPISTSSAHPGPSNPYPQHISIIPFKPETFSHPEPDRALNSQATCSPRSRCGYIAALSQGCLDHKSLILAPGSWQQSSHKFSSKRHIRIIKPKISQTQTHAKRAGLKEGHYSSTPHHKFRLREWKETEHGCLPTPAAGPLAETLKPLRLNSTSGQE